MGSITRYYDTKTAHVEAKSLAALRKENPEAYREWLDSQTTLSDSKRPLARVDEEAGAQTVEPVAAKVLTREERIAARKARMKSISSIKDAVLNGDNDSAFHPSRIEDKGLLTEALFFTASTLVEGADDMGSARYVIRSFLKHGAQLEDGSGKTLRDEFVESGYKTGLVLLDGMELRRE